MVANSAANQAGEIGETEFTKIIVSRDDIQRGQRRDPEDCPVARAHARLRTPPVPIVWIRTLGTQLFCDYFTG